jgi:hypothetical protein
MRLICFICGKSVSTDVDADTIVRAILVCPECMPTTIRDDVRMILSEPVSQVVADNRSR